ncbi:MAG: hypothetical protein Q9200_002879 [Gallowayella weberi]
MGPFDIHPPQLTLFQRLENPRELKRFLVPLQNLPLELRQIIRKLIYQSVLLPDTVYPSSEPTPEPILLCLAGCVSPTWETKFWSENTFVYRAGESPNTHLRPDQPRSPFWEIRKLHVIFGKDDLNRTYVLAPQDKTSATKTPPPHLKELGHFDSPEQDDTLLSPDDIVSLNFPCTMKRTRGDITQFDHLNEILVYTWFSKFQAASELPLTHLTLDFTECHNPVNDEYLGNDVAQNLRPFQYALPEHLVILPDELKMQLTLHVRDANGLDSG